MGIQWCEPVSVGGGGAACVYMYVYQWVCMAVCMCVNMFIHVSACVHMHVYKHVHEHVHEIEYSRRDYSCSILNQSVTTAFQLHVKLEFP